MKPPRLDWRHLECFRVAGRLQHVTRAAEQLGTSQPALSRTLARLEHDLGVPLFHRVGRSTRLTRYGAAFLQRVERALREIDEGRRELADLADLARGTVALGFLRSLGAEYVPQLVRRFGRKFPDVRFTFMPNNGAVLAQHLERGDLDLIFSAFPAGKSLFAWSRVRDQELVLIVSNSHRLARRRHVALREVANEPFVAFKSGAIRQLTDELCAKAGFAPSIVFEGDDSSSVPGFVAAGFGVAVVPPESGRSGSVVSLRIKEPSATRGIGVAWVPDRYLSASARAFRDFAIAPETSRR